MSELKNCPFCGVEAEISYSSGFFSVCCSQCCTGGVTDKNLAIAAWNRRADGWVSVSERMPRVSEHEYGVLVADHEGCVFCASPDSFDESDFDWHWQPLPEPPEAGQ